MHAWLLADDIDDYPFLFARKEFDWERAGSDRADHWKGNPTKKTIFFHIDSIVS